MKSIDPDGDWGWKNLESSDFWNSIFHKIKDFESMTWGEIFGGRSNHPIGRSLIVSEAQKRLMDLRLDDVDDLYQLRVGGRKRIWGLKIGNVFKVLWWDPNHSVYPMDNP